MMSARLRQQEQLEQMGALASPLDRFDVETLSLASEMLLLRGHEARHDPKDLFELVMREETSRVPLVLLPHQAVYFDFVMAHKKCVVIMPVATSKTFCVAALTLWLLGSDPTARGAVISAKQAQSLKVISAVRDYIAEPELATYLKLAFPKLQPSQRPQDPWTQIAITVDRPPGIRDPSLVAVGIDGALPGARLSWIVVDDIYDRENTATSEAMEKVRDFFESIVLQRLDPDGRIIVTNTPWSGEDLTQLLQRPKSDGTPGWPTLIMDILGNVTLVNVDPSWDSPALRPSKKQKGDVCRLVAHDPDPEEQIPLWPEKFDHAFIADRRANILPHRFNQSFMCQVRDDMRARCKREWIDRCLRNGRGMSLLREYKGSNIVTMGVDLAFGMGKGHDETAFITEETLPGGQRVLLDVESGQWDTPTVLRKLIDKQKAFNSIVRVENNGSQDAVLQFARSVNASLPIKAHTTGRNKADPSFGVESLFVELMNGAWTFPCDSSLRPPKSVQKLIDGLLGYEPPPKHTPDLVMAMWMAREQSRQLGDGVVGTIGQGIARAIMSR